MASLLSVDGISDEYEAGIGTVYVVSEKMIVAVDLNDVSKVAAFLG